MPDKISEQCVSLILVDDHAVVRQGTREMISQHTGFKIVTELSCCNGLEDWLNTGPADVVLLDINLPGQNGFECLDRLKPIFPSVKFILFSAHNELQYIRKAQKSKADGFLSKLADADTLIQLILHIARQPDNTELCLSDDLAAVLKNSSNNNIVKHNQTISQALTPREQEVLLYLSKGLSNQGISKELCLSVKTVDTHVGHLFKKLNVHKRTQLAAYAFEQGLV
jgi:DNA-binding NarL/FixJ family response regulator